MPILNIPQHILGQVTSAMTGNKFRILRQRAARNDRGRRLIVTHDNRIVIAAAEAGARPRHGLAQAVAVVLVDVLDIVHLNIIARGMAARHELRLVAELVVAVRALGEVVGDLLGMVVAVLLAELLEVRLVGLPFGLEAGDLGDDFGVRAFEGDVAHFLGGVPADFAFGEGEGGLGLGDGGGAGGGDEAE